MKKKAELYATYRSPSGRISVDCNNDSVDINVCHKGRVYSLEIKDPRDILFIIDRLCKYAIDQKIEGVIEETNYRVEIATKGVVRGD